jgi:hypothetical protein
MTKSSGDGGVEPAPALLQLNPPPARWDANGYRISGKVLWAAAASALRRAAFE